MSKGGSQSQSTMVDPATQRYVDAQRQYALGAVGLGGAAGAGSASLPASPWGPMGGMGLQGGMGRLGFPNFSPRGSPGPATPFAMPGLPPEIAQAQQQYQDYAKGGNLGFSALTGNADAASQFMNPYLAQMNPFFAQQRQQAVQGANDLSTQMGAFGGDRSGIAAAQAGNLADQTQAGFNYQGFTEAMQRALSAANLGYGASAQAAFLPQQYYGGQLGLLNQGMGPYGQTQTTHTQSDPFSQALGLGLTLFGPGGLLAKGAFDAAGGAAAGGLLGAGAFG